jgi:hypothetical protein
MKTAGCLLSDTTEGKSNTVEYDTIDAIFTLKLKLTG